MYGAIEAGGTKFICAVGTGPEDLRASKPIPTTTPDETLAQVIEFFRGQAKVEAIGIGAFGPVDVRTGTILKTTPKLAWRGCALQARIETALGVRSVTDTDVNVAALGEHRWGAAKGCDPFLYLTIGTGIGGGGLVNGQLLHGLMHPEIGHLHLPRHPRDKFAGVCPTHGGDCLEGLVSGPALALRDQKGGEANAYAAHYLALGLLSLTYVLSPRKIVLGGGVMKRPGLLTLVKKNLRAFNRSYAPLPVVTRARLGDRAGVLGGIALVSR